MAYLAILRTIFSQLFHINVGRHALQKVTHICVYRYISCILAHISHISHILHIVTYLCISALYRFIFNVILLLLHITMQVIASVEKYENAGMKFSTVPAFALAESRASDACCLFLVQKHTRAKSACFPPQESSDQVLEHTWRRTASTHELRPVPFPCATCRPPPMQPCCDACFVSQC